MTSSPAPDLDELERLAKAATEAPWEAWLRDTDESIPLWKRRQHTVIGRDGMGPGGEAHGFWTTTGMNPNDRADAAYIVALVNAAPTLLQAVRAAHEAAPRWHHDPAAPPERFCEDCDSLRAESGRLREALREEVEALPFRFNNARDAALLATPPAPEQGEPGFRGTPLTLPDTPPAPSDHGAGLDPIVRYLRLAQTRRIAARALGGGERPSDEYLRMATAVLAAMADARLAAPSVPPEPASPEPT